MFNSVLLRLSPGNELVNEAYLTQFFFLAYLLANFFKNFIVYGEALYLLQFAFQCNSDFIYFCLLNRYEKSTVSFDLISCFCPHTHFHCSIVEKRERGHGDHTTDLKHEHKCSRLSGNNSVFTEVNVLSVTTKKPITGSTHRVGLHIVSKVV